MTKSRKQYIIGVMGGAQVPASVLDLAYELGARIAVEGWVLLNGGRDAGVMRASAQGAKSRGGLTVGILPGDTRQQANPFIDIPIVTNLGDARNVVNILSSDVVVVLPGGAGPLSEIALALKNGKKICLLQWQQQDFFASFAGEKQICFAETVEQCIGNIKNLVMTL